MTDTTSEPDRLPVSILTGFLGSGKTTLLSKLMRHPEMDRIAVIVNEFGEVGLDDALVMESNEDVVLLNSGCLCCTVRGDLVDTLKRLFKDRAKGLIPDFDRIVVETTGLADPAPILHTMMADPFLVTRFRLDGVITVVDAHHAMEQFDKQFESVKQAAVADRIVLTKTDVTDAEQVAKVEARLAELNPAAPVIKAVQGDVSPSVLFNAGLYNPKTKSTDVSQWLREEAYRATEGHVHHHDHHHDHGHDHDHGHHHHDVSRHDDHIHSFVLYFDEPLEWNRIAGALDMMAQTHGANILRIKGLLNLKELEDEPVVVHAVQHMFHPPAKIEKWPNEDRRSRLVFIVRDLDKKTIESVMNSYLALEFA
ncbi:MAG: GTP-binding protein [Nisaea sp.]|jgi:G3E family GTPase|uniref:CobW family GTP-binding protein n=1 Tax=Nisaea sp. TaxID=2024842 RepID=UPI001B264650|nr:GTP-binding protein [Nisaea sp.]MBO6561253.1 GTP-binding protein [Nisaea sp.]